MDDKISLIEDDRQKGRLSILWHDVWMDGNPVFGVGEINGEKVFYNRHHESDGKGIVFRLHRFKNQESLELAIQSHEEYRQKHGGYQDHQPDKFGPALLIAAEWRKFFDYYSHIDGNFFATIKKEDIDNFYPPNTFSR